MSLLSAYEGEQGYRAAQERVRQAFLSTITDPVTREIAGHLHAPESRQDELARLQSLAHAHSGSSADLTDKARIAHVRALRQGNFSALDGLDRELQRQLEEEDMTAIMLLLNED